MVTLTGQIYFGTKLDTNNNICAVYVDLRLQLMIHLCWCIILRKLLNNLKIFQTDKQFLFLTLYAGVNTQLKSCYKKSNKNMLGLKTIGFY